MLLGRNAFPLQRQAVVGANLLVLTIVPGHGAVGSLSLNSFAIWADEDGCHQSQRSKPWKQRVTRTVDKEERNLLKNRREYEIAKPFRTYSSFS